MEGRNYPYLDVTARFSEKENEDTISIEWNKQTFDLMGETLQKHPDARHIVGKAHTNPHIKIKFYIFGALTEGSNVMNFLMQMLPKADDVSFKGVPNHQIEQFLPLCQWYVIVYYGDGTTKVDVSKTNINILETYGTIDLGETELTIRTDQQLRLWNYGPSKVIKVGEGLIPTDFSDYAETEEDPMVYAYRNKLEMVRPSKVIRDESVEH